MNLKDLMAISGESGLFRFIAQGKNAVIVEHIETGKRMAAHGTAKVSSLEDIAIYTNDEEVPLSKIFDLIWEKENGGEAISHKSKSDELTSYFGEVLPEFDRERVYPSDIKKIVHWYNTLQKLDLLVKEEETEEEKEGDNLTSEKPEDKTSKQEKSSAGKPEGSEKKKE